MNAEAFAIFSKLPDFVRGRLHKSVRIETRRKPMAELAIGESRIGGWPDVSPEFEWPVYSGHPLAFLAEINLSYLTKSSLTLPQDGLLLFFYSHQMPWGEAEDRGSALVRYLPVSQSALKRL